MMLCYWTILDSAIICRTSIQMSMKQRIQLTLKDLLLTLTFIFKSTTEEDWKQRDRRDDFTFPIVNFPFISSNILASPANGVDISQLRRFFRAWILLVLRLKNIVKRMVVKIVWSLDLQLPMQSVPVTTDAVSWNLDQGEVYNIMW